MLNENEWKQIEPLYTEAYNSVMATWRERKVRPKEAFETFPETRIVLAAFKGITGETLGSMLEIKNRILSKYGRPCPSCEMPFRTPRAKLCANCGVELTDGEFSGPPDPSKLSERDMRLCMFGVYLDGKLIGHSPLEYGDPPMGIAHGTFLPRQPEFSQLKLIPAIQDTDQEIFDGFEVQAPNGTKVPAQGPVSLIKMFDVPRPLDWQIHAHFISRQEYERIFPHHVKNYDQSHGR